MEILFSRDIEVNRIFEVRDGFALLVSKDNHVDNIFTSETKQLLSDHEFNPVMPPELRSRKSVIIPRVDDLIYDRNVVDIGEEIARVNDWITEEDIESVYKFPNSPTLKVTFHQTNIAKKCTESGLKAFKISIPAHEIRLEKYIPIKCCMRCYALEDHYTSECEKSKDFKVCSECSSMNHLFYQCKETTKKCLNCGDDHSTLAMKCQKRKDIIKAKRLQETQKQNMTYSSIAQTTLPPKMSTFTSPQNLINREDLLKINICIGLAESRNKNSPGTFALELNNALKANNLPTITVPDEVSSTKQASQHQQQTDIGATGIQPAPTPRNDSISRTSSRNDLNISQESITPKKRTRDSKEFGLEFFTLNERGWPEDFSTDKLLRGISNKIYKYQYRNDKYQEEQILKMVKRGEIEISTCFFSVREDHFRKIRSGLIKERSPLQCRDPRLEKRPHHIQP